MAKIHSQPELTCGRRESLNGRENQTLPTGFPVDSNG